MGAITLQGFTAGASVGAYLASQIPVADPAGAPTGAAVVTATAAGDGSVLFSALSDGVDYLAYESGTGKRRRFRPLPGASTSPLTDGTFALDEETQIVSNGFEGSITVGGGEKVCHIFTAWRAMIVKGVWVANLGVALTPLSGVNFWSFRPRRYQTRRAVGTGFNTTAFTECMTVGNQGAPTFILSEDRNAYEAWFLEGEYDRSVVLEMGDLMAVRIAGSGTVPTITALGFTAAVEFV